MTGSTTREHLGEPGSKQQDLVCQLLASLLPCGEGLAFASFAFDCKESRVEEGFTRFGLVSFIANCASGWCVRMLYRVFVAQSPSPYKPQMERLAVVAVCLCWN